MKKKGLVTLAGVAALGLSACAPARVQTTQAYGGPLAPRPDRVMVYDFAVTPQDVKLDQGVSARIARTMGDSSLSQQEWDAAQRTRVALAQSLAEKLRSYGLPAQTGGSGAGGANEVLVQGQIVAINEGNRTRRTLVGLGAGKSSVTADAQLYYVAAGSPAPRLLTSFEGSSDSGRAPGMAETLGVGAAAHRAATAAGVGAGLHGVSEVRRTGDEENAVRLADALAKQIGAFAVSQGWIAPGSVR
jgi:hypothetical protein